jgi:acetyl-CoA carboxylase carboxyl transferase subunit beta
VKELIHRSRKSFTASERGDTPDPDQVWVKCSSCRELVYIRQLEENLKVCTRCGHHMRMGGREWLWLLDQESFEEHDAALYPEDPLGFATHKETYAGKLRETQERLGQADAVISGAGLIEGRPLTVAVCDFSFMGASMGSVYGEKIARAAERAAEHGTALLTVNCSGGARMQEGIISLMQMAKISIALTRLAAARQIHISLLVDPCYGGVTASYASTADIIIAEPGASIGFAGRRVIEQTIRQKLPADFQTAEFMLAHGMVDMVTPRTELRGTIGKLLRLYGRATNTAGGMPEDSALMRV